MPEQVIEYPCVGKTYRREEFGVYEYGEYERGSVLAGQTKRTALPGSFETLEAAKAAYPNAVWNGEGSGYIDQPVSHTAPKWFDSSYAGERWDDDY